MNFESIKIEGVKYLDKNSYNLVLIDLASDVRRVEFSGEDRLKMLPARYKISEDILKYDSYQVDKNIQDEVILQILDHFLEYAGVNEIQYKQKVKQYPGRWDLISGCHRTLMFKPNGFVSNDIYKKVMDSYYNNRAKYCFNREHEIKSIGVSTNCASFGEDIKLLINKDESISMIDQEFLTDFLEDRLDPDHYAGIYYGRRKVDNLYENYAYITCGDTTIELDEPLDLFARDAVLIHNKELKEAKAKQLVLKGF